MFFPIGYGFNATWLLLIIVSTVLGLLTQGYVKRTYAKWSQVPLAPDATGAQMARRVLDVNGLQSVSIGQVAGNLTDNYDPRSNQLSLSQAVYAGANVAAVGVAAHEAGHAMQDAQHYVWGRVRQALVPVANFGSKASFWLIFLGIILGVASTFGGGIFWVGIILYAAAVLFQIVTLPVELNASSRAMQALATTGTLDDTQLAGARQVLTAAALTYVAAALIAALQLLYFIGLGRDR